jgi:regulator of replication initiation timing
MFEQYADRLIGRLIVRTTPLLRTIVKSRQQRAADKRERERERERERKREKEREREREREKERGLKGDNLSRIYGSGYKVRR